MDAGASIGINYLKRPDLNDLAFFYVRQRLFFVAASTINKALVL